MHPQLIVGRQQKCWCVEVHCPSGASGCFLRVKAGLKESRNPRTIARRQMNAGRKVTPCQHTYRVQISKKGLFRGLQRSDTSNRGPGHAPPRPPALRCHSHLLSLLLLPLLVLHNKLPLRFTPRRCHHHIHTYMRFTVLLLLVAAVPSYASSLGETGHT